MSRMESVSRAAEQWAKQLTDVSGRNRLLFYWPLKRGTLDLTIANPKALGTLLSGKPGTKVALRALFAGGPEEGEGSADDAVRRARAVSRKAVENFEERGVSTLFLVQGMATWTAQGSRALPAAPVLMCTVGLHRRGAAEADFDLSLDGEWTVNDALVRFLGKEFELGVSGEELLGSKLSDARLDDAEVAEIFDELLASTRGRVPGFRIDRRRLVLGNFMYRKMPMVSDIEDNIEALVEHDLIASIAGDAGARVTVRREHSHEVDPSWPDLIPPADEFLVLDADSSQNAAINAALSGESFVLQGPPGTGKSQTIANVIATMMAWRKRVLFVAEKRAAIDAVTKRLTMVGLDGFVMDFHGGTLRRRELARHLEASLAAIGETPPAEQPELHRRLEESRFELSSYADAQHKVRDPWGLSFFDVQCRLLALDGRRIRIAGGLTEQQSFPADVLGRLDRTRVPDVRRDLRDWADLAGPALSQQSPWFGGRIATVADVRQAQELLPALASAIASARARGESLLGELGLADPGSLAAWDDLLELLSGVEEIGSHLTPAVFDRDLDQLAVDLAPAEGGLLAFPSRLFRSRYRAARRGVTGLWQQAGKLRGRAALGLVTRARDLAHCWTERGGEGSARAPSDLSAAINQFGEVRRRVGELTKMLPEGRLVGRTHTELAETVAALAADIQTLNRLPRMSELRGRLFAAGVDQLIDEVSRGALVVDDLPDAFEQAWLTSIRREVLLEDRFLMAFDRGRQDRFVQEFRSDDASHLSGTPARVRRWLAEGAIKVRNSHPDQNDLIRKEASKKTRHLPLRRLFEMAPDVLTAVRPCWAMSPLDVAQTLPPRPLFDLVIFDEASQVLPCDAIPALLRAPRAMVAGDSRQLPPTTFFDGVSDEEDDPEDDTGSLADYESILDVLDAMLSRRPLAWHYRSADERLISFSNRKIYHGSLTTFPGAGVEECLNFELVEHRYGEATDTRSNSGEVRRVVDLMIDHARRRPDESLGVIAMGSHHADRIEGALRQRLGDESSPELERFFDESLPERAFVKNLERVQGDERDAIILSVGYGKTVEGRLLYRFGPLNNQGGERRLNVAVTRARRRMTLVSSFSHAEMDPSRSSAEGVRLLREYLRYAESGGTDLSGADRVEPLNSFEVDVLDKLTAAGLSVAPQYGFSGYRIDFAVRHPQDGRRFVLAVEADGASYHSSHTARDRDRLRQEHLERLGWRFYRIWSTDWFNDHVREVDRVLAALDAVVEEIDSGRPGPSTTGRNHSSVGSQVSPSRPASDAQTAGRVAVPSDSARDTAAAEPLDPVPTFPPRGPVPRVPRGLNIGEHDPDLLVRLARWVMSDDRPRTDEAIFEEMFQQMGYGRRGHLIKAALYKAIEQAKRRGSGTDRRQ